MTDRDRSAAARIALLLFAAAWATGRVKWRGGAYIVNTDGTFEP